MKKVYEVPEKDITASTWWVEYEARQERVDGEKDEYVTWWITNGKLRWAMPVDPGEIDGAILKLYRAEYDAFEEQRDFYADSMTILDLPPDKARRVMEEAVREANRRMVSWNAIESTPIFGWTRVPWNRKTAVAYGPYAPLERS